MSEELISVVDLASQCGKRKQTVPRFFDADLCLDVLIWGGLPPTDAAADAA